MNKSPKWTAEQDQYLVDHYLTDDVNDVAEKLGRTVNAIKNRVATMPDLYKRKAYNKPKSTSKATAYQKALSSDRWQDAQDFINMMARFKRRLMQDNLMVGKDRLFGGLPGAFNQYQVDIGR